MDLQDIREQINEIDEQLVPLFLKRMGLSTEVAKYKQAHNKPVLDKTRERELLKKVSAMTDDKDLSLYTRLLYADIMGLSRSYQHKYLEADGTQLSAQIQDAADKFAKTDLPETAWRVRIRRLRASGCLKIPILCFLKIGKACLPPYSRGFAATAYCRLKTARRGL